MPKIMNLSKSQILSGLNMLVSMPLGSMARSRLIPYPFTLMRPKNTEMTDTIKRIWPDKDFSDVEAEAQSENL